jgi:predicted HAD superfamily Cof-like phosphohydrolase
MATIILDTKMAFLPRREYDHETAQVAGMHRQFGFIVSSEVPTRLTRRKMGERIACLREELEELITAANESDLPAMADALVDLVVFAKGTAVMMGLPWAALFDDVMRANLAKVRGVGHRGHKTDLVKPPEWQGPRGRELLLDHGYDPADPTEVDDE